jgi:alpha-tubulin suppressor-like RCC1 family protein
MVVSSYQRSSGRRVLVTLLAVIGVLGSVVVPSSAAAASSLAFTTPRPSQVLAGSVTVEVESSAQQVSLYVDTPDAAVFVGTATTAPFTFQVDTTAFADGQVFLRARAFDISWSVRSRAVIIDNTSPEVTFEAPAANTFHSGWLTVQASVVDANVAFVDLWVGGQFHSRDWTAPYAFAVDTRNLVDGQTELRLRAHDMAGTVSVRSRYVVVANTGGSLGVVYPNPGRHVRGTVGVTSTFTGTAPVALTEFVVNGETVASFPYLPSVVSWDTTTHPEGSASLQLRVTDRAGKTVTSPVRSVVVDRTPPQISFLSPRPGMLLVGNVEVTAAVVEENVETVQLFVNNELAGTRTGPPWVFTASLPDVSGPVALRLVAIDRAKNRSVVSRTIAADRMQRPYSVGSPTATASNGNVVVEWSRPRFDPARPVDGYTIYRDGVVLGSAGPVELSFTDSEPSSAPVVYAVQAFNSAGTAHAVEVVFSPYSTPDAPVIESIAGGDGYLSVGFTPGSDGGSLVLDFEFSLNGGEWVSAGTTESPVVITGVANGTSYSVRLRAVNAAGPGAESAEETASPSAPLQAPPLQVDYGISELVFASGETAVATPTLMNGSGGYDFSVTAGVLPLGVTLDATTGELRSTGQFLFGADQVSVAWDHGCAISVGEAHCWGSNGFGRLGDGTTVDKAVPTKVADGAMGNSGVSEIVTGAYGYHTCALKSGEVFCWGFNGDWGGQGDATSGGLLGDGSFVNRPTPVRVADGAMGNSGVDSVVAGSYHTCALKSGEVFCWGNNWGGMVGDGTTADRNAPTKVADGVMGNNGVDAIFAGGYHTCALKAGEVFCWGSNNYGQLGDDSKVSRSVPVRLADGAMGNSGVSALAGSEYYMCALKAGEVFCWGLNSTWNEGEGGQLGDGTTLDRLVPTKVADGAMGNSGISSIAVGNSTSCAVKDGELFCWGRNFASESSVCGALGCTTQYGPSLFGTGAPYVLSPVQVSGGVLAGPVGAVSVGSGFLCDRSQSVLSCWGANNFGQLGDGSGGSRSAAAALVLPVSATRLVTISVTDDSGSVATVEVSVTALVG